MQKLIGNAIVGQSGGPTAAINATLAGVIRGAQESNVIGTIYGARNGIEGVLSRRLIDLSSLTPEDLSLLENTPAAALGSCRKKLPADFEGENRKIFEEIVEIFKEYDELPGVIHCYAYGKNTARLALDKGLYLGVGGTSTYARNTELREVIKMCPIDRILLETDCPYLSPDPVRRETNNSSFITYVIDNICSLKNMSRDDVIRATNDNAYRLFNFGGK